MAALNNYAFLVKHKSYNPDNQNVVLKSSDFYTAIFGVANVDDAVSVIKKLADEGIQLVELCGGFTEDEKNIIKKEIKNIVPIGLVKLDNEDVELLEFNLREKN